MTPEQLELERIELGDAGSSEFAIEIFRLAKVGLLAEKYALPALVRILREHPKPEDMRAEARNALSKFRGMRNGLPQSREVG